MDQDDVYNRIHELEREIAALPAGSVSVKKVKGGVYHYHRVTLNGRRKETYVPEERAGELREQIEKRRLLEKELKKLSAALPKEQRAAGGHEEIDPGSFHTYIRTGGDLVRFTDPVKPLRRRACFSALKEYVSDESSEKVLILYGLRRTGKTTLMRQVISSMEPDAMRRAVFIQAKSSDTLADINADLRQLERLGFRYAFIDEVTLMQDFIEGAALFSDIFAASGMKIVLSGTDSLGFLFSEDEQLYDRCIMIHTTFIPYREFETVLGKHGIDEYIRYGGTMSLGGEDYNRNSVFADAKKAGEYIDSAIAKNIRHSLQCYQDSSHFRSLRELYERNELTGAINRVVEDMNHRFTVQTLTRTFRSGDLALSARNLRNDRNSPSDIPDRIDTSAVTALLKTALEIRDREEQQVAVSDVHAAEIQEYLMLLDLIETVPVLHIPAGDRNDMLPVVTQPGMRYAQADALAQSIMSGRMFSSLDIAVRTAVLDRIRSEIKGRMMEETVLLETKLANPRKQVFRLQFAVGEFDMVVADPETLTCRIYEIKYSKEITAAQYRHLADDAKCAAAEHRFGAITGKHVIYRGEAAVADGIEYLNVEEYLKSL